MRLFLEKVDSRVINQEEGGKSRFNYIHCLNLKGLLSFAYRTYSTSTTSRLSILMSLENVISSTRIINFKDLLFCSLHTLYRYPTGSSI